MRIAVVSSASAGGAGIAALRVARSLENHAGAQVHFVDIDTVGAVADEISPQRSLSNQRISNTHFTADRGTARRDWLVQFLAGFDVVNLHWTSYVLSTGEIEALAAAGTPILFTLHDFNHVTGGCHYPAGCTGLFAGCMGCPQVEQAPGLADGVYRLKQRKNLLFRHPRLHLAAPSRYVLDAARRAVGLPTQRAHLLRNPYEPLEPPATTDLQNKPFTLLLIADSLVEHRKGAQLAAEALQRFRALQPVGTPLRIHVAGSADGGLIRALKGADAEVVAHGRVTDHAKLVALYAESDVQLSTSHEDNWPNVLVEAATYGCPAIVGPGHGCEEFARLYPGCSVANDYSPEAFASALRQLAEVPVELRRQRQHELRTAVRRDHAPAAVAAEYARALQTVLDGAASTASGLATVAETTSHSELSSNYLGFATRELLAASRLPVHGRLAIRVVRPATASHALTLRAVYGEHRGEEVVVQALVDGTTEVALHLGGAPLRHVFATELSDYGLSTLTCRLALPGSPA